MPASRRRKEFGQHFLRDLTVVEKIIAQTLEEAGKSGARGLLEVGPGKGALTTGLLARMATLPQLERFLIVERDVEFAAEWIRETALTTRATVRTLDFLDLPIEEVLSPAPLVVVSNLPYSAGTAILTRLAAHPDKVPAMILMFQAEVAQRLRAEPGTKSWGSLSVWLQNSWDVKVLLAVPPGAFSPPPAVNSEVVLLRARSAPRLELGAGGNEEFEKLLKVCFQHRRKMLRSGLPAGSKWLSALMASGIDPTLRAEALRFEDWQKFLNALR